ncbi:MAG: Gfo/Idh/MocA family protein [Acidimicrobiales bacterium]
MAHQGSAGLGAVVVGTGFGCLTHVRALRAAGFDVRALVGRDAARTEQRADRWTVPVATTSLEAALALPGVDAVTIATPPHTHAELVRRVVGAGRHVLCEKPFARDAGEARDLLGRAMAAGVVHLLGTEFRWATGQATAARAVADGLIGEPKMATILLHVPLLADPGARVPAWWSDAGSGGGWLGAHATHVIDQVRTTLGEFAGVSASLPALVDRDWTVEDSYLVHFRLRNGVVGTMQSSAADRGPLLIQTRFAGTEGTVVIEGDRVTLSDRNGPRVLDPPADLPVEPADPPPADLFVTEYDLMHATGTDYVPYVRMLSTFADLIAGRTVPADPRPATFADGVANMVVLDAIRQAATSGAWVDIPL